VSLARGRSVHSPSVCTEANATHLAPFEPPKGLWAERGYIPLVGGAVKMDEANTSSCK